MNGLTDFSLAEISNCVWAGKIHNPRRAIADVMNYLPLILATILLTSCAHFQPQPLSPEKSAAQLEARRLDDIGLKQFLAENAVGDLSVWPLVKWDLSTLTLAAFYFHPNLEVARAQWQLAAAGIKTAGGRPNPTLSLSPTYNSTTLIPSPWSPAINFDVPLETMGKRSQRLTSAEKLSESARFNFITMAWQIRSGVRASLSDLMLGERRVALLQKQLAAQTQIVKRWEQRLAVGAVARAELTPATIALHKTQMDLQEAQAKQAEACSRLAEALGVSTTALDGIKFGVSDATELNLAATEISTEARHLALVSRADILSALAEYAAAESDLRLEIAKQYPDVHLNPGYQFDQGDNKWSLGLTFDLPLLNQNQGAIAEAVARRKLAAAKFVALQAQVIGEIDRAVASWHVAKSQLNAANELLLAQQQQAKSVSAQVQVGAAEELDLLSAQLDFTNAELVQLDSEMKLQTALAALEAALQCPANAVAKSIADLTKKLPTEKELDP